MSGGDATVDAVAERLRVVRARIDGVARAWTHEIEITAVTQAFEPSIISAAVAAGCSAIGENYAQELLSKRSVIESVPSASAPRVDFIGHLQSNKVRQLVGLVDRWCTVDRISIAKEIAKRDPGAEVLLQVNVTGEEQKGGGDPDAVAALATDCSDLGLDVAGLLSIGPTSAEPATTRAGFEMTRSLVDDLGLRVCSIGMTGDLEIAVECGSTNVRIGSALFGDRPVPVHQEGDGRG